MKHSIHKKTVPCQGLDLVAASHRGRVSPFMYCHMELTGRLDMDRFKGAISMSCAIIPELLYGFDFRRNRFVDLGLCVDDVIVPCAVIQGSMLHPDLTTGPQIKILVTREPERVLLTFIMSHILADGEGFKQFLYLLAQLYNGTPPDHDLQNCRDITPLLRHIHPLAPTEQSRSHSSLFVPPLRSSKGGSQLYCLTTRISAAHMDLAHQKGKKYRATLNDVFLTAYARAIARMQQLDTVALPCPADLRPFAPDGHEWTVANMTGLYRRVVIEAGATRTFSATLKQVQIEMALQKAHCRCLEGISALNHAAQRFPPALVTQMIQAIYRLSPVSYTNLGVLDHEKLSFRGCSTQSCFLTGAYRQAPDFQLTVSTFQNICTLNCTLRGSPDDRETGQHMLRQTAGEILSWLGSDAET